jgi:hypothetical protein
VASSGAVGGWENWPWPPVDELSGAVRAAVHVCAGQLVVALIVRQSLSRLWVPYSSFHSA